MEKLTFGLGRIEIRTHEKLLIRIIVIHVAVHENSSHRHDIIMWLFSLGNFHNLSQSATNSTFFLATLPNKEPYRLLWCQSYSHGKFGYNYDDVTRASLISRHKYILEFLSRFAEQFITMKLIHRWRHFASTPTGHYSKISFLVCLRLRRTARSKSNESCSSSSCRCTTLFSVVRRFLIIKYKLWHSEASLMGSQNFFMFRDGFYDFRTAIFLS